jgi:S-adenosylmethionine-diacylglycerol 3-amino-3-carboxypropyl transferase
MPEHEPDWVTQAAALPIAFAQVREDPLLDRWVVEQVGRPARVMLIASGGCTAAYLVATGLEHLHLVDANPAQLALTRLKLHLLRHPPAERMALLGHAPMPAEERAARVSPILAQLDLGCDALGPVEAWSALGPDQAGRYERVFARLQFCLRDQKPELEGVLRLSNPNEQARRVAPDTPLGQALDAAFADSMALGPLVRLFGEGATRNPVEAFHRHFARRTRFVLGQLPAASNPFLWQVLLGRYPDGSAAPWLDLPAPPAWPTIHEERSFMADALARVPDESFDLVHLSNILDWLSPDEAEVTLDRAWRALRAGGCVLIRQLNSTLDIQAAGSRFVWDRRADLLHQRDRSYFYRAIHLGKKP